MKAMRLLEPGKFVLAEVERRPLGEGEVRIKVAAAGICGSDVAIFQGDLPWARLPCIPGHEFSGVIAEAADGVELAVGQKVAVNPLLSCGTCAACRADEPNHCPRLRLVGVSLDGGYAEEVIVPADLACPLPDDMPLERGALVEPTAVAVHGVNRAGLRPGDSIAVLGAGAIGMLLIQVARARGAANVIATGRVDSKLDLARRLGADRTVNTTREDVLAPQLRRTCDIVFDFVGSQETLYQAFHLARTGSKIVFLAAPHGQVNLRLDYTELYRRELTATVSRLYDADFHQALPLIASGQVNAAAIVTHRFPMWEVGEAMRVWQERRGEVIKILLEP